MKRYYCVHCGRLLGAPVAHRCRGTFRSRNLQFKAFDLVENMNEDCNIDSRPLQIGGNHYRKTEGDPISLLTIEEQKAFFKANIIKYTQRYQDKNGLQDLYKAQQYLDWLIGIVKNEPNDGFANLVPMSNTPEAIKVAEEALLKAAMEEMEIRLKREGLTQRQIDNILDK